MQVPNRKRRMINMYRSKSWVYVYLAAMLILTESSQQCHILQSVVDSNMLIISIIHSFKSRCVCLWQVNLQVLGNLLQRNPIAHFSLLRQSYKVFQVENEAHAPHSCALMKRGLRFDDIDWKSCHLRQNTSIPGPSGCLVPLPLCIKCFIGVIVLVTWNLWLTTTLLELWFSADTFCTESVFRNHVLSL